MPGLGELQKKLELSIEAVDRTRTTIDRVTGSIIKQKRVLDELRFSRDMGEKGLKEAIAVEQNSLRVLQRQNEVHRKTLSTRERNRRSLERTTRQMGRFRMELLSVMFFAMGVRRVLGGLIKPSLQAAKTFELAGNLLKIVFLPEALKLNKFLMNLWKRYKDLDEPQQKFIKAIVIAGVVLATVAMVLAAVGLGIAGLKLFLAKLVAGKAWTIVAAGIKLLGAAFWWILGVALVVLAGLYISFQENFLNIRKALQGLWEGIKMIFGGIFNVISGIFQIVWGILKGDLNIIKNGISNTWDGIISIIGGVIKTIINLFRTIGTAVARIFYGIFLTIRQVLREIINFVIDKINWVIEKINAVSGKVGITLGTIPHIPAFQTGGYVPETGLAMLHAGEYVLPSHRVAGLGAGGDTNVTFSPIITITGNSPMDINRVKAQLTDDLVSEVERRIRG
tara:strand:- start:483 stop:1832 length:1350 start_codon:yes stop_codon:yes gene_type:complete